MVGGQYGEGALRKGGKTVGYYRTTAVSYGLQADVQKFGYALFFMSDAALQHLNRSDGWEVGVGPSVVVLDEGMAKTLSTTTLRDDVYAFVFRQRGLMAGWVAGFQDHADRSRPLTQYLLRRVRGRSRRTALMRRAAGETRSTR